MRLRGGFVKLAGMEGELFDERDFFAALASSGARVLLIGRRAMIALGLPVVTNDYALWVRGEDAALLNAALAPLGLAPNRSPEEARIHGRYVLENSEHVDVLTARAVGTVDGKRVVFAELWKRRRLVEVATKVEIAIPSIDDLIDTKRFGARPKDAEDIRILRLLKERQP